MTTINLSKREKSILLFFIKGTLSDLSKAFFFFLFFYIIGFHREFLCSLFFLVIFRVFCGGIHCKTYLNCLILSFAILSSGIFLGTYVYLSKVIMLLVSITCGVITCALCPVLAPTRPVLSKEAIKSSKLKEGTIIGLFIVVLILVEINRPINIGFWLLVLHTIQLGIAYIRR